MSNQDTVTVTISTPNNGVSVTTIPVGTSARTQLEEAGVNLETATVMVNGEASTLDAILGEGDRLVATRDGKGA